MKNEDCVDTVDKDKNRIIKYNESLTTLLSLLARIWGIVFVYLQYRYCQSAENFYNINADYFMTDNLQRLLLPSLLVIFYTVTYGSGIIMLKKSEESIEGIICRLMLEMIAIVFFIIWLLNYKIIYRWLFISILIIYLFVWICISIRDIWNLHKKKENTSENINEEDSHKLLYNILKKVKETYIIPVVFIIFLAIWTFFKNSNNEAYFINKKYEVIYDNDTKKSQVEVVILHKGSQIITMQGCITNGTLYIYKNTYELKESGNYKYELHSFNKVIPVTKQKSNCYIFKFLDILINKIFKS